MALRNMKTTDMSEQQLTGVKINRERLWADLHKTCEWGKGERWGEYVLNFLVFVHEWFGLSEL